MMSNEKKYYLQSAFTGVATLFVTGSLAQALLAESGFTVVQIGIFTSLISVAQVAALLFNIFLADRIRQIRKVNALLLLAPIPFLMVLLYLAVGNVSGSGNLFGLVLLTSSAYNFLLGFQTVVVYRLIYLIIKE